ATVFKVPHHGSSNADQPRVWEEALGKSPWAILTPMIRGRNRLPKESDRRRLLDRTGNVFIAASPERLKRKRDATVEATLKAVAAEPVILDPPMGQVRLRSEPSEEGWEVDLFGPARPLAAIT
ncbi:MAG TPA: hypothetical protein VEQ41_02040, partial [Solirubrobacterales bacterium]|nr:hypothetical protein [Solirubrobacterales bacterium]